MSHLKPIHILIGVFGLIAFVLTGQYMAILLAGHTVMADMPRLLYRTSHLYLMWASLVNLLVGFYFAAAASRGSRLVQAISSILLMLAPFLMLASFIVESPTGVLNRQLSTWGNYFALAGVILHVAVNLQSARARRVETR